ncbi:hypothetical protein AJ79_00460 [Helicocarpus griseus UAMH5409]|uniref:F-box domain-containing protein n=1 Tax=Helicocarpus griseus UAMH5409 TaxID=1447875 RepID=A0A2B7YBI8_9EURO|nr:hypothetical protein AJ79_00460 [Helicocarpus griseus UAMH5409]
MDSENLSPAHPELTSIETLPNELLDHVFSYISPGPPPSAQKLRQTPSYLITSSSTVDLKNVSRTCQRFRGISRPRLFAHTCHELPDQERFLGFLHQYGLARHVKSAVVYARSTYPSTEKPLWWTRLLEEIDPLDVVVIAPPHMFAHMALKSLNKIHAWAFQLQLQTMQFRQSAQRPSNFQKSRVDNTFFSARPWTEILFNEGSSLKAYNNYEYYLLRIPSIMDKWGSFDPLLSKELPYPAEAISRFTSFHYTAVFPFYNHTNSVLKVIRNMSSLRQLSMQLAPGPDSTIFEEEQQMGTLDPNDPWMELDTSYSLIAHAVRYLGVHAKLVEFRSWDFELEPLRDSLVATMDKTLKGNWIHDNCGLWMKV